MNISFDLYSPHGPKVTLSAEVKDLAMSHQFVESALRSGYSVTPPAERKDETIVTVVRRKHEDDKGRVTPVIDMYPAWKGEYGQFRFIGIYLNTPEDVAQFEAYSGLVLDQIPLYASEVPLKRKVGRVADVERTCRPFTAYKREDGLRDVNGVEQMSWKFAGYGAFTAPTPNTPVIPALPTGRIVTDQTSSAPDETPVRGAKLPKPSAVRPASIPSAHRDASFPLGNKAR